MEQKYLIILATLIGFYCIVIFYLKNKKSQFDNTINQQKQPLLNNVKELQKNENINHLDTRYDYPLTPPVNPNVYKTQIVTVNPANSDLYSTQDYLVNGYALNQNDNLETNQLDYSGGSTQLLKIPLQFNEPFNEQLRTQEVLITPYNKIKYNTMGNCSNVYPPQLS